MGTLISCHKISKISAQKDATDCVIPLQSADYLTESATDDKVHKTVVTELNIGDGGLTNLPGTEHEYPLNIRTNKENKPRPGAHRQNSPTEKTEKSKEVSVKRALQYDYLLLPGQVSPKDERPTLVQRAEKIDNNESSAWSYYDKSTESKNLKHGVFENQLEGKTKTHQQQDPQENKMDGYPDGGRSTVTNHQSYQDENSNIVQEGTSATQERSTHTDAELTKLDPQTDKTRIYPKVTILGYDSRYINTSTATTSPPRKILMCKTQRPPNIRQSRKMLRDQNSEFMYSLEEAFQRNVPCSDEVLEASAVTGMPSFRLPHAPLGKYPISWELKMMMRGTGSEAGSASRENSSVDLDHMIFMESQAVREAEAEDDKNDGEGHWALRDEGNQQLKGDKEDSKIPSGLHPVSSDKAEKDDKKASSQADKSNRPNAVDPRVNNQPSAESEEAVAILQSVLSHSILAGSPGASDAGSIKSTVSTDADHSQNVPKEKTQQSIKQSSAKNNRLVEATRGKKIDQCQRERLSRRVSAVNDKDPKGQGDKFQEPVKEITKEMKPSGEAFTAANGPDEKQTRMSYQAIQEAVSLAILKLSNIQASEHFPGSERAVEVDVSENAAPTSCHPQQTDGDQNQSVTFQKGENRSELIPQKNQDTSQENSMVCLKAKDSSVDKTTSTVRIHDLANDDTIPAKSPEQTSVATVGAETSIQTEDGPSKNGVSPKETEYPEGKSEDWEIVPLHRVFGQTDLSRAIAQASLSQHGETCCATSRSLPPSVGTPVTIKEHFRINRETAQNTLPEEQMINMALSKSRRITAVSHEELKLAGAKDPHSYGEGPGQSLPLKMKACSSQECAKADRLPNKGIPNKSPKNQITTHQHLQLAEDSLQTWGSKSPTHQTTSTPELALSLTTSETQCLSPGDDGTEWGSIRNGRSVPRDANVVTPLVKKKD